jgi:hypothetical protein
MPKLKDLQVSSDEPDEPGQSRVLHFNNLDAVFHEPQLWRSSHALGGNRKQTGSGNELREQSGHEGKTDCEEGDLL